MRGRSLNIHTVDGWKQRKRGRRALARKRVLAVSIASSSRLHLRLGQLTARLFSASAHCLTWANCCYVRTEQDFYNRRILLFIFWWLVWSKATWGKSFILDTVNITLGINVMEKYWRCIILSTNSYEPLIRQFISLVYTHVRTWLLSRERRSL